MSNPIYKTLREKALEVSKRAHAPYSNAFIGSAIETMDGKIYTGCNIENSSYGGTVCAERVAIWKCISEEGPIPLKRVYVYSAEGWPPCGMCRQVMSEFASAQTEIIIGNKNGEEKVYNFSDLMPLSFTPDYLIKK